MYHIKASMDCVILYVSLYEIFELNLKHLIKLSIQNTVLLPYGQVATGYERITTGLLNHYKQPMLECQLPTICTVVGILQLAITSSNH